MSRNPSDNQAWQKWHNYKTPEQQWADYQERTADSRSSREPKTYHDTTGEPIVIRDKKGNEVTIVQGVTSHLNPDADIRNLSAKERAALASYDAMSER